ncbi:hydrolase [filamentous cyanobacterium CCP5]|nr:hydrolase [filamentous cyanobacterium CCP5]
MLKAILFDLDGTLANTDPIHLQIWADLLAPHGYEVDKAFYQEKISGRLNAEIVRELLPHIPPEDEPQFSADKEAHFRDLAAEQLQPMPGLLPLLEWGDAKGLKMAVVTNAPRSNAEFMLKVLDLESRFQPVIIADELERGKPDPLPYQEALRRLDLAVKEAVIFEDSTTGIRSAAASGVTTIGIASTHDPATLCDLGAVIAVKDFTDDRLEQFGLGI